MGRRNKFAVIVTVFLAVSSAWTAPTALTYQGRILKSDGTPLTYNNVSFIFQITNPAGSCVIYQEQVTGYDMTNSAGVFDMPIGSGSISFPLGGGATVVDTFNNLPSVPFTCGSCSGYTCTNSASTYSPVSTDGRLLRVKFYDGASWQTITPDSVIRSVPFAGFSGSAEKLGNNVANDFLLKAGLPTCGANTFLAWNGSALSCQPVAGSSGGTVTNVSSANADISVATGTSTPVLTLNSGTTANQIVKLDAAAKLPAVNGSQLTNLSAANISGIVPVANGGTNSSTALSNNRIMISSGGAIVEGPVMTNGQILIGSTGAAPQVANLTAGSGVTVTNSAGGISIGLSAEVGGVNGLATTGYVQRTGAGAYSTTAGSTAASNNTLVLRDGSGVSNFYGVGISGATSGIVTFQSPATVTSYSLKLPAAQGGANQMLTNDGAGNLSWSNLSSLGVASVAVTSPITNSGTASAPNIGIQVANTTQAGYLSSADWNTFNGKQSTSLTSANILVGNASNVATAVAPSGDVSMTNAGAFTVTGLRGKTVSATAPSASGQVLRYDNGTSTYIPSFLGLADIRASITPFGGAFASAGCTASQSLYWQSSTDTFLCQNISVSASNFANQGQNSVLAGPSTGGAGAPAFRALASADLPSGTVSTSSTGTSGYHAMFTAASTLANSSVFESAGNVGIGTTTPSSKLHLITTGSYDGIKITGPEPMLQLSGNETSANSFTFSESAGDGYIKNASSDTGSLNIRNSSNHDVFSVNYAAPNGSFTVNGSGNVGIGTTSPASLLHIAGDSNTKFVGTVLEDTNLTSAKKWFIGANVNASQLNIVDYSATGVINTGTTRMTIDSTGNVGIGATSPTSPLDITMGTTGYAEVAFKNASTGTTFMDGMVVGLTTNSTNAYIWNFETGNLRIATSNVERMRFDSVGNIGIGTTTPTGTLDVEGGTAAASTNGVNITLAAQSAGAGGNNNGGNIILTPGAKTGTGSSGAVLVGYSSTPSWIAPNSIFVSGSVYANSMALTSSSDIGWGDGSSFIAGSGVSGTGDLEFYTSNAERMRIDATGKIGIGNTAPSYTLDITGTMRVTGQAYTTTGNGSFTILSDARFKDVHGSFNRGLDDILNVKVIRYNYLPGNPLGSDPSQEYIGVTAQNLQKAIPEAVNQEDGYLTVNTSPVLWTLVNAVKELYNKFTGMDRAVASVNADNAQLKAENAELKAKAEKSEKENAAIKAYLCGKDPSAPICK